jgi:hypothetical protein
MDFTIPKYILSKSFLNAQSLLVKNSHIFDIENMEVVIMQQTKIFFSNKPNYQK